MRAGVLLVVLTSLAAASGCRERDPITQREPMRWSAWIEDAAVERGYVKPGDFAQFGCPPGWRGVEDTAAALRGSGASATYRGADPPPREGTVTCVAQREFVLPPEYTPADAARDPAHRPLAPVWIAMGADSTTIGFRQEVPPTAALYIGQDTPCGPRLIGVRLGDLLKWLVDPHSATKRDFLGLVSAGCPT